MPLVSHDLGWVKASLDASEVSIEKDGARVVVDPRNSQEAHDAARMLRKSAQHLEKVGRRFLQIEKG